jgi:protein TonB
MSLPSDVFRTCDPDVEPAKPIRTVKPPYTGVAMRAKVEGSVVLFGIVDRNGVVGQVRVVESLERSLDAEAQKAFEQWRFRPAMRNGEPVSLAVSVEMTFVLR